MGAGVQVTLVQGRLIEDNDLEFHTVAATVGRLATGFQLPPPKVSTVVPVKLRVREGSESQLAFFHDMEHAVAFNTAEAAVDTWAIVTAWPDTNAGAP